jgi:Na+-driven multidrug efflux pump
MSKFKKNESKAKMERQTKSKKEIAFNSVITSTIFGIISLFLSFLFNGGLLPFFNDQNIILNLIGIIIKTTTILLFFLFMVISVANYVELIGKRFDWKYLLLLFSLSLIQSFRDIWVFLFSLIGLSIIIAYFYVIQEG